MNCLVGVWPARLLCGTHTHWPCLPSYWLDIPARKGGVAGGASWAPDGETIASGSHLLLFLWEPFWGRRGEGCQGLQRAHLNLSSSAFA